MSGLGNAAADPTVEILVESVEINELPDTAGAESDPDDPAASESPTTEGPTGGE